MKIITALVFLAGFLAGSCWQWSRTDHTNQAEYNRGYSVGYDQGIFDSTPDADEDRLDFPNAN